MTLGELKTTAETAEIVVKIWRIIVNHVNEKRGDKARIKELEKENQELKDKLKVPL